MCIRFFASDVSIVEKGEIGSGQIVTEKGTAILHFNQKD